MVAINEQIASKLLSINAIKINAANPFTWASGLLSPIYCDNRVTLSDVETRELICNGFLQNIKNFESFDVIAGVATGGIAHGMLLADRLKKPFIYIRPQPKSHGLHNAIEGRLESGQTVLMIEDLVSTGGSSFKAVESVRSFGNEVVGMLSIFTYGFADAINLFKNNQVPYQALTDYPTLLEIAAHEGYVNIGELDTLKEWRLNPTAWSNNQTKKEI